MNKKGIIALIVVIIIVVVAYKSFGGNGSAVTNSPVTTTPAVTVPAGVTKDTYAPVTAATADMSLISRLKSASVAASETGSRVALSNGKADFSTGGVKGSVTLGDIAVSKTIGATNYAITTFGVTSGKTTEQYAVLFQDVNGSLTDKSYALIGAGVKVTGLRADDVSGAVAVSVSYMDASGKAHTMILVIENGEFNASKTINL